jgi:hypothetical protein
MLSNRLAVGALAIACIAAAGIGGYIASRQDAVSQPAVAAASDSAPPIDGSLAAPVQETEAVVEQTKPSANAGDNGRREANAARPAAPAAARTETASQPARPIAPRTSSRPDPAPLAARADSAAGDSRAASAPPSEPQRPTAENVTAASVEERAPFDASAAEPPQKEYQELVVAANAVIGLQTENRISSETARIEDRVEARVTRDVKVGDAIAIPAGSRALGTVTQVERGGKFKDRARLGIRFTTLVLADGTRMSIGTDTIYREGEAPGNSSAAKIGGGAVGGAILGAILGGAKGAAIGATAGAGGGAAVVQAGDRSEVTLPAGSPLTVRLVSPLTVTVEAQ